MGTTSKRGKMLAYIVSQRGIEVDPEKVKEICEIPQSKTEKEI